MKRIVLTHHPTKYEVCGLDTLENHIFIFCVPLRITKLYFSSFFRLYYYIFHAESYHDNISLNLNELL